jgi:hypothetical protein
VWYNIYECGARNAGIIPVQEVASLFSTYVTIYRYVARNARIIPVQEVSSQSLLYVWYNIQNMSVVPGMQE